MEDDTQLNSKHVLCCNVLAESIKTSLGLTLITRKYNSIRSRWYIIWRYSFFRHNLYKNKNVEFVEYLSFQKCIAQSFLYFKFKSQTQYGTSINIQNIEVHLFNYNQKTIMKNIFKLYNDIFAVFTSLFIFYLIIWNKLIFEVYFNLQYLILHSKL